MQAFRPEFFAVACHEVDCSGKITGIRVPEGWALAPESALRAGGFFKLCKHIFGPGEARPAGLHDFIGLGHGRPGLGVGNLPLRAVAGPSVRHGVSFGHG